MGFFSQLLGIDAADASREAAGIQARQAGEGIKQLQQGTAEAQNYLSAYAPGLQGASDLYQRRLGVFGPDRQAAANREFQPSVGLNHLINYQLANLGQGRAALGGLHSGKTALAGQEIINRNLLNDYWQQMSGLQGLTGQGINLAGSQANLAYGGAQDVARGIGDIGTIQATGITGAANARAAGAQNILNTVGGLGQAAIGAYGLMNAPQYGSNNLLAMQTPDFWRRGTTYG